MIYEDVRHELARLSGAGILYERTMDGEERWLLDEDGDAPGSEKETEWPLGNRDDVERSYGLFFLTLGGREFRFEIEGEFMDEEDHLHPTTGVGRIGYAVAASGIAPFALLRVTSLDSEAGFVRRVRHRVPVLRPRRPPSGGGAFPRGNVGRRGQAAPRRSATSGAGPGSGVGLERVIEAAREPGYFVGYRRSSDFVRALEEVRDRVVELVDAGEATRAASLVDLFIAGCYEKSEEIDDSAASSGTS